MNEALLKNKILALLEISTIPDEKKREVIDMMPLLKPKHLQDIYNSLRDERVKMGKLDRQQNRVELKYSMIMDRFKK
ncbi:MAG: hypothetical protein V1679_00965 [Candidatus Peregrinibacteria bacterium]